MNNSIGFVVSTVLFYVTYGREPIIIKDNEMK